MTVFDECLKISQKIQDYNEKLKEINAAAISPKNQVLSGMPRGGDNSNAIERYIIRKEVVEKRVSELKQELKKKWNKALETMSCANIDSIEIQLMKYRFYYGLTWSKCSDSMKCQYPNELWNENKCFRVYRIIMSKINKDNC